MVPPRQRSRENLNQTARSFIFSPQQRESEACLRPFKVILCEVSFWVEEQSSALGRGGIDLLWNPSAEIRLFFFVFCFAVDFKPAPSLLTQASIRHQRLN